MESRSVEIKVGLFVLVGIIIIAIVTLFIGEQRLILKRGYNLYAEFDNVAGMDIKGPVRIAGVEIGLVSEIGLKDEKARIRMDINPDVEVYKDATAELKTYGLLGDKFIMIYPGTPESGLMADGDTITNTIPEVDLNDLMRDLKNVSSTLNEALGTEETKDNLKEILANMKNASENINDITAKLNNGEGTLGKLINDDTVYDSLKDVAEKVESGEGTLGKLAHDDSLYLEAKDAMKELKKSSEGIQEQTPISVMGTIFGMMF
jgi:phospholipid/cholesterol/gamma-HCH transport system substrate-binding protein